MKKFLLLLSILWKITSSDSFACMKSQDIIQESMNNAATKKTFSTAGLLISNSHNGQRSIASGVLLDPYTVLSCAHGVEPFINCGFTFTLLPSSKISLTPNSCLELENKLTSLVDQIIIHPTYKEELSKTQPSFSSEKDVADYIEWMKTNQHDSVNNPDKALARQKQGPKGCGILELREGADLAMFKLKKPIHPPHGFFKIGNYPLSNDSSNKGFSIGYPFPRTLCDGTKVSDLSQGYIPLNKLALENSVSFHQETTLLYERHFSPASRHGMFSPNNTLKFAGLITPGMSGGPLLSRNSGTNEFEVLGIVSRSESSPLHDQLQNLMKIQWSDGESNSNELQSYINNMLNSINSQNTPIYNVWTPVAPYIDWIKGHMCVPK